MGSPLRRAHDRASWDPRVRPKERSIDLVIHADSSLAYYGFYLAGFESQFEGIHLKFSRNDFPALLGPRDGLAVITPEGHRIFIAADDHTTVNEVALAWSHAYGKVNVDRSANELAASPRIVPIGPSFGIRWGSNLHAIRYVLRATMHGGRTFASAPARIKAALLHQRERLSLAAYEPSASEADYLFFAASFWAKHLETNPPRQALVLAARERPGIVFEGGLVGDPDPTTAAPRSFTIEEYLERTRRSMLVFNTPAVHRCLGWKLGEFLALGKAIVSLPISREMPEDLVHGEHVHLVDGSAESVGEAIDRLHTDLRYRRTLEHNARQYFDRWLRPEVVIRRLVEIASEAAS